MNALIPNDLHRVLANIPRDIRELLKNNPNIILAGGCIRSIIASEKINDYDLFGPSRDELERVAKDLAIARGGKLHTTANAYTVLTHGRTPVQFIFRWTYAKPIDVVKDFDFSIAQAAIYWDVLDPKDNTGHWMSVISDHYYADIAGKRLRYLSPKREEDAGGSILRVQKFLRAGYFIDVQSFSAVIARLCFGVEQIKNNIDEEFLSRIISGLLLEVDPMIIIDGVDLVETSPGNNT